MANASLAPVLLVSMPQMIDPNFSKTVVLLAEYGAHGAFGLVLNRRMPEPAQAIVTADEPLIDPSEDAPLHGRAGRADARVDPHGEARPGSGGAGSAVGVYLSASPTLVRRRSRPRPIQACAWWWATPAGAPVSSMSELAESSWLLAPVESDLIFSTPVDDMWETAIRRLGAEPSMLQGSSGVH